MKYKTEKHLLQGLSREEAARTLFLRFFSKIEGCSEQIISEDMNYYSWPEIFASTAGPFGGAGGQAVSTFQMEAWEFLGSAVLFCQGKYINIIERYEHEVSKMNLYELQLDWIDMLDDFCCGERWIAKGYW